MGDSDDPVHDLGTLCHRAVGHRLLVTNPVLRLVALGLFGVTALKLVLFDLARAEEIYRIVSFMGLGLLMIAASYLYHRMEKKRRLESTRVECLQKLPYG